VPKQEARGGLFEASGSLRCVRDGGAAVPGSRGRTTGQGEEGIWIPRGGNRRQCRRRGNQRSEVQPLLAKGGRTRPASIYPSSDGWGSNSAPRTFSKERLPDECDRQSTGDDDCFIAFDLRGHA